LAGLLITGGSVLQLIAAGLADPRVFSTSNPVVRMQAIAANRPGWVMQAILFPVAFSVVAAGFGVAARALPGRASRRLALAASLFGGVSVLLWLPISINRIGMTDRALALALDPQAAATADIGGPTFWPYTGAALGSVVLAGLAFGLGGWRRRLATGVSGLAALGAMATLVVGDWPPFVTYVLTLVLGIGVLSSPRGRPVPVEDH